MIENVNQKPLIKLEVSRKLLGDLPHTIDELGKDWRHFLLVILASMSAAVHELVTKT